MIFKLNKTKPKLYMCVYVWPNESNEIRSIYIYTYTYLYVDNNQKKKKNNTQKGEFKIILNR